MAKREMWELQQKQSLPLNLKISLTKARIRQWINEYGEDGVYVSFSGGKDSTVLLDLVRQDYPNVKAVFFDTGLEYPEIREFVKTFDNIDWIKPKMNFREVITKYGYPMISKEVSECVHGAEKNFNEIIGYRIMTYAGDNPWTLGDYSTKEKALCVMEMLRQQYMRHLTTVLFDLKAETTYFKFPTDEEELRLIG